MASIQRFPANAGIDQATKRFVIYVTVGTASLIAFAIIFTVALLPMFKPTYPVPPALQNWGGVIVGFYFGTFMTLLKDWSRETVEVIRDDDKP